MNKPLAIVLALATGFGPTVGADPVRPSGLDRPKARDTQAAAPDSARPARVDLPPTTGPHDLPPVDSSVLPPPEERWDSPEEQAQHRRIMDELWATKLGQLYLAYLTEKLPPVSIPGRANQIIDLISANADKANSRFRVVQLLTQDLYAREQMTEDVTKRTIIFDRILQAKQSKGEEALNSAILIGMFATFVLSLPFGYEGFRDEGAKLYQYSKAWFTCRDDCKQIELNLRRLMKRQGLGRYHFGTAFDRYFLRYFGPASMFYFVWYQWKPSLMNRSKSDQDMLNGRDDLLEDADF